MPRRRASEEPGGTPGDRRSPCLLGADLEAAEAPDHDVLAGLLRDLSAELLDCPPLVLRVHVLLVQQDNVLESLLELALDDPAAHVLGLVGGLLLENTLLARNELVRH